MAVVIGEIVTETVLGPQAAEAAPAAGAGEPELDLVVRRAVERVLEVLRREWDR
jgi:hypothetical protein